MVPGSPHSGKSGIICDGAVRSGKTLCMSLSFVSWAFYRFRDTAFALCGKTVASLRRNVLTPLTEQLTALGFTCTFKISRGELTVRRDGRENRFYLFGGRDESSAALIQGMTLGGVLAGRGGLNAPLLCGAGAGQVLSGGGHLLV